MKKILAIVLSALLLMTVCASLSASADGGLVISIDNAKAAAGEEVAVNFNVDSNSGIWAVSLDVAYDTSILTLESVTFGPNLKDLGFLGVEAGAQPFTLNGAAAGFDNCTDTGVMATATFKIADTAKVGDKADITVTFNENNQIDADANNVATTVNAGSVEVIEKTVPTDATTTAPTGTTTVAPTDATTAAPTDATAAPTDATTAAPTATGASPATGSALPIAAIVLAAGSAAVLTFARKK